MFNEIKRERKKECYFCIVGTKNDLEGSRKVSSEDVLEIVQEFGVNYMECSSLTGFGVEECVFIAARELHEILIKDNL